jgi:hypothetical protein
MSKQKPIWLAEALDMCRTSGIKVVGWGPEMLTVEAKSGERAREIASQLGVLGFKVIPNEDDANAGLLNLSKNRGAVQEQIASFDISRRRWDEQIVPLIWAFCSLMLIRGLSGRDSRTPFLIVLGSVSLIMFFRDGARIWGWKVDFQSQGLRVRRYYRWATIPWEQIRSVETASAYQRDQESVVLKLKPDGVERLGSFSAPFARGLRDRLKAEIEKRGVHG